MDDMTQCRHVSRLTGLRCELEPYAPGAAYCVKHDLWHTFHEGQRVLLEGFRAFGEPALDLGILDMNVVVGQYLSLSDEQIAGMLKKYGGDQTHLIPWVRQLIDSSMPTKNERPL